MGGEQEGGLECVIWRIGEGENEFLGGNGMTNV
jgi:hypothetical protein